MAFDDNEEFYGDYVVRRDDEICVCEEWRVLDQAAEENFRRYKGCYSREGFIRGETNPLSQPREPRRPVPLRGC